MTLMHLHVEDQCMTEYTPQDLLPTLPSPTPASRTTLVEAGQVSPAITTSAVTGKVPLVHAKEVGLRLLGVPEGEVQMVLSRVTLFPAVQGGT